MNLRQATARDRVAARALLAAEGLPLAGLEDPHTELWVAEENGEVASCAALEHYGEVALLRSVATRPERRGQGHAASLCEHLLAGAKRDGVRKVYLLTTTAEDYFRARGFDARPRDGADPRLQSSAEWGEICRTAVLMERSLSR